MERIIILTRTTKKEGNIKLRFRLYDGRDFELFHKSQISASLEDLKKFNIDGSSFFIPYSPGSHTLEIEV